MENAIWTERYYYETLAFTLAFLILVGSFMYFSQKRKPKYKALWASTQSWFLIAPLMLIAAGAPYPWPLVLLTLIAIYSSKTFFRMVGIYHRNWFVLATYAFIALMAYTVYKQNFSFFNVIPMIFIAAISLIPILRNNHKHMVQYIALTLMAFIFFGWALMHFGFIMQLEKGIYICIYLAILSEFCEGLNHFVNLKGKLKPLNRISPKFTIEGLVVSTVVTIFIAWAMRRLLPYDNESYWIAAGLCIGLGGRLGELFMTVIRRDLGIKDTGVFIIGRDDILARVDKLIFVGPLFYYLFISLQNPNLLNF